MPHRDDQQPARARTGAPGRPRKDELDQRRSHLIEVATALFLDRGYHRVSLALIAQEARVAVRTIYLGFGGKAGLLAAALQKGRQRFMTAPQALDPSGPLAEVLGHFGRGYLHYLTDPEMVQLRRMALAEASTSAEMEQAWWEAGPAQTQATLARYFVDPRVRAQLRPEVPLDLLPSHFMACIAAEHSWPRTPCGAAPGGRSLQQLLDARLTLFLRSAARAHPRPLDQ